MRLNGALFILLCLFLCFFSACDGEGETLSVSPSSDFSVSETSEISESIADIPLESKEDVSENEADEKETSPIVDWESFLKENSVFRETFSQYDPEQDMPYDEYFSTERYLNSYELQRVGNSLLWGEVFDMWGYRYVKGGADGTPVWDEDDPQTYRTGLYDNLYLLYTESGERVLLAEVEQIRHLMVFIDRLYLITDNAVWVCGRLGENLTCVYEHPTRMITTERNSSEILYFIAEGDPWSENHDAEKPVEANSINPDTETDLWRLYLPTGQADKVCIMEDLPSNWDLGFENFQALSNYAVMTMSQEWKAYVYSTRTGSLSEFAERPENGKVSLWDAWVRKYYPLNQY